MLYEGVIYVVWNTLGLYIKNLKLTDRRLLSVSNAHMPFVNNACVCVH